MNWWLVFIPLISAFIGWVVNLTALKILFHPRHPIKILGITFQGIFPKRQQQFASKLGKVVSSELLSFEEIEQKLVSPDIFQKLLPLLETHIDTFLREKLTAKIPMLGMLIGDKTIGQVKEVFLKELEELLPEMMKQYLNTLQHELNLEKIVVAKLSAFSLSRLEEILNSIIWAEFRFIKILGAVAGFIIGVIQVLITLVTR
jgi:uncharacterized membrane protein YheB (UPF0754 family)